MVTPLPYYVGSWVKVRHAQPYLLPDGLPDGASVKVIAFLTGYREVEYRGKLFTVAMPCIDRPLVKVRE